jgi:hypothetical protein
MIIFLMIQMFSDILEQVFNATRISYFNVAVSVFNTNLNAYRSPRRTFSIVTVEQV